VGQQDGKQLKDLSVHLDKLAQSDAELNHVPVWDGAKWVPLEITSHTHAHADTTGQTANDHHGQVHAIGGGNHSGTMTLAQLNAFISDATLVNKDAPNIWTRKQTIAPTEAEEAIEATGGASQAAIVAVGGDAVLTDFSGGGGIVSVGGAGNGAAGGGDGIETEGGQGGATGPGGRGGGFGGGEAGASGDGAGGIGVDAGGGDGYGTGAGGIGSRNTGGGANGSGNDGLSIEATPDVKIKTYSQASEPTLLEDEATAFWEDTDDSNKIYLIFRRGAADQVKIQLT